MMHLRMIALTGACILLVTGCTTIRTTSPHRSAQEELLISTAADRAADALAAQIPPNLTAFVDTTAMDRQDKAYAVAAIEDAMMRRGVRLVTNRDQANAVILPRSGVLSTNERSTLVGLPSLPVPTPIGAAPITTPELSLYASTKEKGIAKFAATVYEPKTGKLIVSTDPAYGFSRESDGVVLFLFTWSHNDMGLDMNADPVKVRK